MKGSPLQHIRQSTHRKIIGLWRSGSGRTSAEKSAMGPSVPFRTAGTRCAGRDSTHQLLRGAIIVALALSLVLYFVGLLEGRGDLETLEANNAKQSKRIQAKFAALEAVSQILTARDLLYRSMIELDQSKSGLANRDIERAGSIFHSVHHASVGIDRVRIEALQEEIAPTTIPETTDRRVLRNRILRWIKQVDALLPGQPAQDDVR